MSEDKKIQRVLTAYEDLKRKDFIEVEIDKKKFANEIKNNLGKQINDFNTYVKPEPSLFTKIKTKIVRIFKYI
jgi:hypothetical protein